MSLLLALTTSTGTIFTITPSGSINLSGLVASIRDRVSVPAGTLTLSGTVVLIKNKIMVTTGSVAFIGTGTIQKDRTLSSTGQVVLSGTGNITDSSVGGLPALWRTLTGVGQ